MDLSFSSFAVAEQLESRITSACFFCLVAVVGVLLWMEERTSRLAFTLLAAA